VLLAATVPDAQKSDVPYVKEIEEPDPAVEETMNPIMTTVPADTFTYPLSLMTGADAMVVPPVPEVPPTATPASLLTGAVLAPPAPPAVPPALVLLPATIMPPALVAPPLLVAPPALVAPPLLVAPPAPVAAGPALPPAPVAAGPALPPASAKIAASLPTKSPVRDPSQPIPVAPQRIGIAIAINSLSKWFPVIGASWKS
jgi:hypothetical protein